MNAHYTSTVRNGHWSTCNTQVKKSSVGKKKSKIQRTEGHLSKILWGGKLINCPADIGVKAMNCTQMRWYFNYAGVMLDKPIEVLHLCNKSPRLTMINCPNSCSAILWKKDDFRQKLYSGYSLYLEKFNRTIWKKSDINLSKGEGEGF